MAASVADPLKNKPDAIRDLLAYQRFILGIFQRPQLRVLVEGVFERPFDDVGGLY